MANEITSVVRIGTPEGWHARPATQFATLVSDSGLTVTIGRTEGPAVRGDSVLTLLTLGARFGEELTITVQPDSDSEVAERLIEQLTALF